MNVSRVVYSRRVNTGNNEYERFEVEVILEPGENSDAAFNYAKNTVRRQVINRLEDVIKSGTGG